MLTRNVDSLMFSFLYFLWGWYPTKQCTGISLIPGQYQWSQFSLQTPVLCVHHFVDDSPLFVGMYHSPMSGRLKLKPFPPYVVKIQSCSFTINVSKNYFIWSRALTLRNIWFLWTERPRSKRPLDFHNEQLGSCAVCGAPWIINLPWLFFGKYSTKEK